MTSSYIALIPNHKKIVYYKSLNQLTVYHFNTDHDNVHLLLITIIDTVNISYKLRFNIKTPLPFKKQQFQLHFLLM